MSYMLIPVVLLAAGGIWFFANSREQAEATQALRKVQAAKRKVFQEQAAAEAGTAPQGGRKRQRGFGPRG